MTLKSSYIVVWHVKGGIVEPEKTAVAGQRFDKQVSATETMFFMRFVPRLHRERRGPSGWAILEFEVVKYGHESHGNRTREWLRWRGPAAIVKDRPFLSSERMSLKGYDNKGSVK
jgi:hypothetical protein